MLQFRFPTLEQRNAEDGALVVIPIPLGDNRN